MVRVRKKRTLEDGHLLQFIRLGLIQSILRTFRLFLLLFNNSQQFLSLFILRPILIYKKIWKIGFQKAKNHFQSKQTNFRIEIQVIILKRKKTIHIHTDFRLVNNQK